jgi:two-component system sensor histidine kinase KdpD
MEAAPLPPRWLRLSIVSAAAAVLFLGFPHLPHINVTTVALICLFGVVLIAVRWTLAEAVVFAILADMGINYFFVPPYGTFRVADNQNWIALLVFLAVAVIGAQVAQRARRAALVAAESQQEAERLYAISQELITTDNILALIEAIPMILLRALQTEGVALYLSSTERLYLAGDIPSTLSITALADSARNRQVLLDNVAHTLTVPVRLGVASLGSLFFYGNLPAESTVNAISGLVGVAIERAKALESLSHAEARRESEHLRTALLDSVAHDLRTPLTSILAAVTALHDAPQMPASHAQELISVIHEESDRLNRLIGLAIEMAKWEESAIQLRRRPIPLQPLLQSAIRLYANELEGRSVKLSPAPVTDPSLSPEISPPEISVLADPDAVTALLGHLLQNAARYTAPGSAISIAAVVEPPFVIIRVTDHGPGIPPEERERVFDKFYRGRQQEKSIAGTGLGLAIVKAIAEAHGGHVWVEQPPHPGACFAFTLPLATL